MSPKNELAQGLVALVVPGAGENLPELRVLLPWAVGVLSAARTLTPEQQRWILRELGPLTLKVRLEILGWFHKRGYAITGIEDGRFIEVSKGEHLFMFEWKYLAREFIREKMDDHRSNG